MPAGGPPFAARPPAPAPIARPPAPITPLAAPVPTRSASSSAAARRDPFGLDVAAPRRPEPAPVAPPTPALDLDWTDVDVAEGAPAPAAPLVASTPKAAEVAAAPLATLEELDFAEPPASPAANRAVPESAPQALAPVELPELEAEEDVELAPAMDFVPKPEETGHQPEPAVARDASSAAFPPLDPMEPPSERAPAAPAAASDGGEAQLRDALSRASREVIERIAWEVVPELAETIIREQLDRLVKDRQR